MPGSQTKFYSIQETARKAGVSSRTLRFYDEIHLLSPAYRDPENGYRYYRQEQLLRLQQILLYRNFGIELAEIRTILDNPDFDLEAALRKHRARLQTELERTRELVRTIERTLARLTGEATMQDDELFAGFDSQQQAGYEDELVARFGSSAREQLEASRQKTAHWGKPDYEQVREDFDRLHQAFTAALRADQQPEAPQVQRLVEEHYRLVARFWTPDATAYTGLGDLYKDHPDFRRLYDGFHAGLAAFLATAMRIYAQKNLTA